MAVLRQPNFQVPATPQRVVYRIPDALCPGYTTRNGHWKLTHQTGEGSFGACFKAEHTTRPGAVAAFKVCKLTGDAIKDRFLESSFSDEFDVMVRIQKLDAYTPKVYGISREAGHPCIIMEYFEHNMRTIKGHRLFGHDAMREYAHDIAQSLYGLHSQGGTLHKDVKPDNILVREPHSDPSQRPEPWAPIAFLTDYGTASWDARAKERVDPELGCDGTAVYTSPECWKMGECQRGPADMWAMGMALLSRWLGYHPLDKFVGGDGSSRGARRCLLRLKEGWVVEAGLLEGMDDDMASFLTSLLTINHRRRLTAHQALLHPFLATTRLTRQKYSLLKHNRLLHPHPPLPTASPTPSIDSARSMDSVASPTPHSPAAPLSAFNTPTNLARCLVDASFKVDGGHFPACAQVGNWMSGGATRGTEPGHNEVSGRARRGSERGHGEVLAGGTPPRDNQHAPWRVDPPNGAVLVNDARPIRASLSRAPVRASPPHAAIVASPPAPARASPRSPLRPIKSNATGIRKKVKTQAAPKLHGTRAFTRAQELVLVVAAEAAKPVVRRSARVAGKGDAEGRRA
ncbi:uncharacterized protein H6S33_004205 [Morchella sextelata]|uniref:uncharacterized protein n=1 Tax=Morchella sextelata TaxID=1174677 RepID=UPI001D04392B|nr:uncharacterized protein H6S33_004205 [Morchella sextelata]KAH0605748.1 hypothetical protein H6S33_004205 [Morchella sextelata]